MRREPPPAGGAEWFDELQVMMLSSPEFDRLNASKRFQ